MAVIHEQNGEIHFKIVYCGTPRGGKTSNLAYIHRRLDPRQRGNLVSIATPQDRTVFFDLLPVTSFDFGRYRVRFQLYTVPGQSALSQTRESVLQGADGIVFVTDSGAERRKANVVAWGECREAMDTNGLRPDRCPIVFQHNKRDLPDALPPEEIDDDLGVSAPAWLACATSGYQIFATLDALTQMVLERFSRSGDWAERAARVDPEPLAAAV